MQINHKFRLFDIQFRLHEMKKRKYRKKTLNSSWIHLNNYFNSPSIYKYFMQSFFFSLCNEVKTVSLLIAQYFIVKMANVHHKQFYVDKPLIALQCKEAVNWIYWIIVNEINTGIYFCYSCCLKPILITCAIYNRTLMSFFIGFSPLFLFWFCKI